MTFAAKDLESFGGAEEASNEAIKRYPPTRRDNAVDMVNLDFSSRESPLTTPTPISIIRDSASAKGL